MRQGEGSSEEGGEEGDPDADAAAEVRLVPQDSAKGECVLCMCSCACSWSTSPGFSSTTGVHS
jgi:hypothetical protein